MYFKKVDIYARQYSEPLSSCNHSVLSLLCVSVRRLFILFFLFFFFFKINIFLRGQNSTKTVAKRGDREIRSEVFQNFLEDIAHSRQSENHSMEKARKKKKDELQLQFQITSVSLFQL